MGAGLAGSKKGKKYKGRRRGWADAVHDAAGMTKDVTTLVVLLSPVWLQFFKQ